MIARVRRIDRVWLGMILAAAVAIAGPFGLAVGFHSPPVGHHSHPAEVPAATLYAYPDEWNSSPGAQNGYTVNVYNFTSKQVIVTELVDTLPAGFSYIPDSTTGFTHDDPVVSGRRLTWPVRLVLAPWSSRNMHFEVRVATRPGNYANVVDGTARRPAIVYGTGPSAHILVGQPTKLVASASLIKGATPTLKYSARLTANGKPLAGQFIEFSTWSGVVGGWCYAYTNANGVAECSSAYNVASSVLGLGYDAAFNPWWGVYAPSYDHGDLVE